MTRKRKSGFGLDDSYINSSMKDWDVPGLSIAVVKDGKTVLSKGYGICSADDKRPVDQNTLFTIGSCTKAFTATAIAILVMEKKLSWDDPVCKFLPDFALLDPQVTAKLTLRDMASHQSGVEDGKVSGIPASSTDEAIKLLASIKATQPFRAEFAYNNTMFAVLGRVVEKVSGMSWEAFLTTRILGPLGMKNSFATSQAAAAQLNTALPFHADNGSAEQMDVKNLDFLASSAGMQSNVEDLTKWLNFQLGRKRGGKKALLSKALLDEMHSEQLALTPNPFTLMMHPGSNKHCYGLAWFTRDYAGSKIVQHGGYVDGFTSFTAMGPAEGYGVVVLSNMHNSLLPFALAYRVIDAYLGQPTCDWSDYFLQKRAAHRSASTPHEDKKD